MKPTRKSKKLLKQKNSNFGLKSATIAIFNFNAWSYLMVFRWSVVISFFLFASIYPTKKIEIISDFYVNEAFYTEALKKRGLKCEVTQVSIKKYKKAKKKSAGFLSHFWSSSTNKLKIEDEIEKIVFFNIPEKLHEKYDLSRFPKEKMILFMWEPKTVQPSMYQEKVWDCFSKIYTWDDHLCDGMKFFKFFYPCMQPMKEAIVPFWEKKLCTLVASDLTSSVEGELYSARREVIEYFEGVKESSFLFFGRKWDPTKHESYRGEIKDKLAEIAQFRFCFCYENMEGSAGYITEKIFDCFAAGTVPIYLGASNIDRYIPRDCFIDRRDFSTIQQLHEFLLFIKIEDYEKKIAAIREFLNSKEALNFHEETLADAFFNAVAS